jgi:heme/copper-type cytochrome/quinol oxidase subunit 3
MGNKLVMKLFIASEAFFFLSLMVAYVYFWQATHFREEALQRLDMRISGLFTMLLLSSSLTFFLSERAHARQDFKGVALWLSATVILGLAFLFGQAHEYYKLISKDFTLSTNEFGTSFYTLTGFHGLHVLLGLIFLGIILGLSVKGCLKGQFSVLATAGIYWHFVDAVWLVVFTLIYVLPHFMHL